MNTTHRIRHVPGVFRASVALALALSASPLHAQTAEATLAEARGRHARAVGLMQESPPNYGAAITEFSEAYRLLEGHPRRYVELRNIAECYQNLGQYDRALEYFRRYLDEGGPEAEDRPRYEGALQALEAMLGAVDVAVNVPTAEVWADSRLVGRAPGRVRIPGGRHVVELRASGYSPARQEVELASRQTLSLRFSLEPLGRRGLSPVLFWTGVGATSVALGVGAVFGALALSARSDVDQRLASPVETERFSVGPADRERIASRGQVADALYVTAAALGAATAVVYFLTDFRGSGRASTSLRVAPVATPLAYGLSLGGAF